MPPGLVKRASQLGLTLQDRCAKAIAHWDGLEDPADIEDAVMQAIPREEPMRSEMIDTLAQVPPPAPCAWHAFIFFR